MPALVRRGLPWLLVLAGSLAWLELGHQPRANAGLPSIRIDPPNLNIDPSRLDPFNKNSDVRRGLREIDKRGRQAGRDLDKGARDLIRKIENFGSEEAFIAYRDHVISRNIGRGNPVKKDSLHYRMIQPAFPGFDITQVRLHWNAYVPGDMAAVTFGNNVYLNESHRPNDPHQALLIGHEIAHSQQYRDIGGERAFARRYWGQIWKEIRRGNFTNTSCMHDSLGLEKEAEAREKIIGKKTRAGVSIYNRTRLELHYAIRMHDKGKWHPFTVKPGHYFTHSTNFVELSDEDFVFFSIRFDHSFAKGIQEKSYRLDYEMVHNGKPFVVGDGEEYHFSQKGEGIDLFTGKGKPPADNPKSNPKGTPLITLSRTLNPGQEESFQIRFVGGTKARVSARGQGNTDVDLFVYDGKNLVKQDVDLTDNCLCEWTPTATRVYRVVLRNLGKAANKVVLQHNGTAP